MLPVLPRKDNLELLRKMLRIRRFEEACIMAADRKQVPGHYHVYIGQEATGVGVAYPNPLPSPTTTPKAT